MASIQILNGASFAIGYPVLNLRSHAEKRAELLDAARSRTSPGTRFAIDPVLLFPIDMDAGPRNPFFGSEIFEAKYLHGLPRKLMFAR